MCDFGVGNTADALGVRLGAATAPDTFLAGGTLQYSTDGVQWVFFDAYNRFRYPGTGAYTTVPTAGDLYFDKVSLLLHMDGADGSTAFTDKSSATKTVTANGNARISTAQGLWGGASGYFDGNGDYLALPSSAAFGFGLDDFTIEAFIYISGAQGTDRGITDFRATDGSDVGTFFIDGPAGNRLAFWHGAKLGATGTALEQNTWYHVVLCRGTGVMRCFLNGVLQWSSSSAVDFGNSRPLGIAGSVMTMALGAGSSPFFGHMRELRITKGSARYTANFSPPTEPFPNSAASNIPLIAPALHTNAPGRSLVAVSAPVPAFSTRRAPALATARDVEVGGPGAIYGTTKTKGTPNQPAKARVVLLHQRSKLPVRETWSDPITGAFAFTSIDVNQQFLTLAEDAAGNFRPVAANRLTPEVLP